MDVLKPGQVSNKFHYHLREEEHIFILKGCATLVLGPNKYVMQERDYCCFPNSGNTGVRATASPERHSCSRRRWRMRNS
jgi:uncharacterized cupin superfamily protein